MLAGSVPTPRPDHPRAVLEAGLAMLRACELLPARTQADFQVRIDVHIGPVPAGVMVVFGVVWEASVHLFDIPVYLLPAPSVIWTDSTAIACTMLGHTTATLYTVVVGFIFSILVSLPPLRCTARTRS